MTDKKLIEIRIKIEIEMRKERKTVVEEKKRWRKWKIRESEKCYKYWIEVKENKTEYK